MLENPPLDAVHRELLELLLNDASFRQAFTANPGAALLDRGLIDSIPPDAPATAEIPPAEELRRALEANVLPENIDVLRRC